MTEAEMQKLKEELLEDALWREAIHCAGNLSQEIEAARDLRNGAVTTWPEIDTVRGKVDVIASVICEITKRK